MPEKGINKKEEKDDLYHINFENNETLGINKNEENNQLNAKLKGKDEIEKQLEKMKTEHNEQKKWLNLEITKQNDIIAKLKDQNNELKSKIKTLTNNANKNKRKNKVLNSQISKLQNENDKIKNRTTCKSIIDYIYGSLNIINKIYDMFIDGNNTAHSHDTADNSIQKLLKELSEENEKTIIQRIFSKSSKSIELIFTIYDHKYKEENDKVKAIICDLNSNASRKKSFLDSL